jgi:hypothetical protein
VDCGLGGAAEMLLLFLFETFIIFTSQLRQQVVTHDFNMRQVGESLNLEQSGNPNLKTN